MSYIMKPPAAEAHAPPYPKEAPFPGYTQPPRKSYRWVWITLGIVALLTILGSVLLGLGAGWAVTTYSNSSLHACDMYYSAIKHQDYSRAYSYLGSSLQAVYSQQTFTQAAQQQDAAYGEVGRFGMTNIPTSDPANITLTVTRTKGVTYAVQLEMRQEGGAWKVTAFNRI